MFDTMTLTKATAGVCGSFLVLLLGHWAADVLYSSDAHGEQSYVIEVADASAASEDVVEVSFEELMASADAGKGAKVFKKCAACHKLEAGVNSTGPSLYGVVGRATAAEAGFGYSGALTALGTTWSAEELDAFLTKPSAYASGTSMSFAGLRKQKDRVNLIAYLDSLDD
ncbi:cytochrome c family protein [Phaeobacter sp. 11ANDIMAR09]|uniref:c-type cytochrome n=1 Tax=Phaeobacter sp. 11ANDIMAR09 TaxID=1225647 RepID=UPI0006C8C93C|nr:cytochrome c family protein [Phaeobacter sp. 11ANDIMAR09]KPD13418.1 cytochrome C [Phaeobacter sp. 11ANDIMAR09]